MLPTARVLFPAAALIVTVGCGGGGGSTPAAPTPSIPQVGRTYSGNVTITFPELSATVVCPASTTVTQSGSTVTVAPILLRGECDNLSIPLGQTIIDATGAIQEAPRGTINEPSCGTYNYTASGGFFGSEFRLSMTATSSTCYNFNFTMVLTR